MGLLRACSWIAICLALCACSLSADSKRMLVLPVKPGMTVAEVTAAARLQLDYATLSDNSSLVVDRPVQVVYADRQHGFTLPESRFVWLPQRAGVIVGIETITALAYTSLAAAHQSALASMELLRNAGWISAQTYRDDLDSIVFLNRNKAPGVELRKVYGRWQLGTVLATIYVKEHSNSTPTLTGAHFLSGIDFADWSLHEKMETRMFDRRELLNRSIDRAVPLSEWVK